MAIPSNSPEDTGSPKASNAFLALFSIGTNPRCKQMSCDHDLDAEYLYPSDVVVLDLYEESETDSIAIRFALPCPDCDATIELVASVDQIGETDLEIPIEDTEELYD